MINHTTCWSCVLTILTSFAEHTPGQTPPGVPSAHRTSETTERPCFESSRRPCFYFARQPSLAGDVGREHGAPVRRFLGSSEAKGCCENGAQCGYCHLPHGERVRFSRAKNLGGV